VRIGLDLAQQRMPWSDLVSRAQFADDAGFDGIWGFDHFQPMYGSGPGECFEGYTTLAALSGVTKRVRLGLLVTGVTYRPPALLAAEAITIDHASGGRLELALGGAWFDKEHRELGFQFPSTSERIEMLDEQLQVLRALLTTDDVTFQGRHYQLENATLHPRPVQQPHPPIWVGAQGERKMLPLVARWADAWHCFGNVAMVTRKSRVLDECCERIGRDPSEIMRAASIPIEAPIDEVRRQLDAWRDAGVEYLIAGWPSAGQAKVEELAAVLPAL
jgi:F420-dependent oxidoreductase-like protein